MPARRRPRARALACAGLMLALAGCSLAALNEPLNFATACQTDTALSMAQRSSAGEGVVDPILGRVAELVVLKDAGRTTAYTRARDKLLAEHESMTAAQIDEAVDSKVKEIREARARATGKATC
ncbi:MAG TPA: hypothetical protein VNS22_05110 [Geminicoccus sp.]|uniref:hypothetical protein n=1 Tax=Geminicoccus sp. TaxID=2024832 RepID=UPI002C48EC09|nr:hypothetical protein [Geminicoccus sp.]HWL67747.1 hypothetical protein [Geminicoccus sp.]